MKNKTIIYGASDDLIEIDGLFSEELNVYPKDGQNFYIAVSDGTLIEGEYDGEWKFRVKNRGSQFFELIQSVGEDKEHDGEFSKYTSYSDLVVFHGKIEWVLYGDKIVK